MKDALSRFFGIVQNKKATLPASGVLMVDDPSVPFSVTNGEPMAVVVVAETDADVSNYQSQNYERFIDARNNVLYELGSAGYTTRPYYGEDPFFRPMTLCFSPSNKKVYYADDGLRLSVVNIGDNPYVQPIKYSNRVNGVTTKLGDYLAARRRHTMTPLNGMLYIIGGQGSGQTFSDIQAYDPVGHFGTKYQDYPTTIVDHTAVVMDGKIWVYGGNLTQAGSGALSTFRYFDPNTGGWTTLPNGPVATQYHTAAVDPQGRMYIHGGSNDSAARSAQFHRYDPNTGVWEALPNARGAVREHTMTAIGNHLYVFGGDDANGYSNALWRFDITTDAWEHVTPVNLPPTKNRHAAGTYNGRLYIFGGNGGAYEEDRYNDLWEYNPEDNRWRQLFLKGSSGEPTSIPIRQVPAYTMVDGVFYFHGGNSIVNGVSTGFSNDFWKIE